MGQSDMASKAGYLNNAWYMAAWSSEVSDSLLSRVLAGRRVLITRRQDGAAVALRDRCPHRFAPLSCGRREGDHVVCGYHGLRFDFDGRCVSSPYGTQPPSRATVTSYPVCEKDGIVWLWTGDPEQAESESIPSFSFVPDTDHSRTVCGYTLMKANYEYGTDNLMDLSHIEFVHTGSFAGQGVIFSGKHKVTEEGDTLHSDWWMPNIDNPSFSREVYASDQKVDHWLDMRWNAPASMRLKVGSTPTGTGRENGFQVEQAHILTPETEHTTHYFWSSTRFNDIESEEFDAMLIGLFTQAFDEEDKPIIEAAYANLDGNEFWGEEPVHTRVDAGGTRARRMLQKMIAEEQATLTEEAR